MKAPVSFTLPMTKEKYQQLCTKLSKVATVNGNAGSITTHDVTLNWSYDDDKTVTVNVTKVNSLAAHIASEEQVQEHITNLLNS